MAQLPQENSIFARTVRRAAGEDRLSHAVILTGRGDLTAAARFLAAAHVCEGTDRPCLRCRHCRKVFQGAFPGIHPDVALVERAADKSGKLRREITVDQIRALAVDAAVLPNEADGKVYIFPEADTMNIAAQNAFLKLLEEPPRGVMFLLCAESREKLLETVQSRCGEIRLAGGTAAPENERARGYLEARLDRAEPELNVVPEGSDMDTTTPDAVADDMVRLVLGDVLAPASRGALKDWLIGCRTGDKRLRAGLPKGWTVGDKTGTGPARTGTSNDVAITWPPGRAPLVIASYLTASRLDGRGSDAIHADVARAVTAGMAG